MSIKRIVKTVVVTGGIGLMGLALAVTACGPNSTATTSKHKSAPAPVTLHFRITGPDDGKAGPDGAKHDLFAALDNQPITVGQKVTLSIENTDDAAHSLTAPDLGLNIQIPGGQDGKSSFTTYTFTPKRSGTFRWYCAIPCDSDNNGWDMTSAGEGQDQTGFMAGTFTVVAG